LKVIVFSKCPQFTEEVGTINWKGFWRGGVPFICFSYCSTAWQQGYWRIAGTFFTLADLWTKKNSNWDIIKEGCQPLTAK
jgi:hypothetical protein